MINTVQSLFRLLASVVLAGFALGSGSMAFAVTHPEYRVAFGGGGVVGPWKLSKSAACEAVEVQTEVNRQEVAAGWKSGTTAYQAGDLCKIFTTGNDGVSGPNGDLVIITQQFDGAGGDPTPNACGANTGKVGVVNFTEGYTRTPDEGDRAAVGGISRPPTNGEFCQSGCKVSAQTSGVGVQPYVSQFANAQGLYRRSLDMPTVALGEPCTASDADKPITPTTVAPACPGSVGEVNGKTVCVGTAQNPVATQPLGQSPAGSSGAIAGNPPAGIKPDSGEGSGTGSAGRTPGSGTGVNSGGPSAAGVGGTGGTAGGTSSGGGRVGTQSGSEQQNCGAPGQPACKIDETGTPSEGKFDAANAAADAAKDAAKAGIDAAQTMTAPEWSFSFQLPTGCTAYQVASFKGVSFTLNPCAYQSTIHDLMSMIWAAVTAFCLIGMVGRTIREA